jgi:uncharacterized membrane protein
MRKDIYNKIIFIISILGIILSGAMWWYKYENKIPPCTLSGCEHVLTGPYSEMFGTPVAAYGFFFYITLAGLSFQALFIHNKLITRMLGLDIIAGVIFTIYLRYLEIVKIGDWCQWCWVSVVFMIFISVGFLLELKNKKHVSE